MQLINKDDRIFIAGHKGMVGSAIKRKFELEGYKNILVVSKKQLDLRNRDQVENWFFKNKPNVVILAAAKVGGIYANDIFPADFIFDNLSIQINVIQTAFKNQVKRLLFLGSSCIYPKLANQPLIEDYLLTGSLEETNEWYAIAKIAGIKMCDALRQQFDFDAISLMPTNLYGTNDNYHPEHSHVFASFIKKYSDAVSLNKENVVCWGSGSPKREFLCVDDLADASLFALEQWSPTLENAPKDNFGKKLTFLNVGSGIEISIKELSEKISNISGFKGETIWDLSKPDGTPRKLLDSSKLSELGWKSKISLDEGIRMTLSEYSKLKS